MQLLWKEENWKQVCMVDLPTLICKRKIVWRARMRQKKKNNFWTSWLIFMELLWILQGGSYLCWPVHNSALQSNRFTTSRKAHTNLAHESVCLMANNVWNEEKLLTLWTAWRHYVSRWAVWFMHGNMFMICHWWVAVTSSISHLFLVTFSQQYVL
jgi:hypothetical protein